MPIGSGKIVIFENGWNTQNDSSTPQIAPDAPSDEYPRCQRFSTSVSPLAANSLPK